MYLGHPVVCIGFAAILLLSSQASALGRISDCKIAVGGVELTVETTPGDRYQIQYCTDLPDGKWATAVEFVAVSDTSTHSVDAEATSCFFRVVKVEVDAIEPPPPTTLPPPIPGG